MLAMTSNGNDSLTSVRTQLQKIIQTQIELGIMVHDFQATPEAKDGLVEQMNFLVKQMDELNTTSYNLPHMVPLDVIEYIENGRNPDVYTREFVELLAKQNQYINGKMNAMKQFRDILAIQIREAYPDLESAVSKVIENTDS